MKDETLRKIVALVDDPSRCSDSEARIILDALTRRAKVQRQLEAHKIAADARPGTLVRLKNIKPKYFNGAVGTVITVGTGDKRGKLQVEVMNPDPRGVRRFGHSPWVGMDCLEIVEEG